MKYLPLSAPPLPVSGGVAGLRPWLRTTSLYRVYKWLRRWKYRNKKNGACDYDSEHHDPHDVQRDVVILTLSERRVLLQGTLYEIYSDPLVELLHKQGLSTLVWEQGEERYPRYSRSAWISRRMDAECRQFPLSSQFNDEPHWFGDYQKFTHEIMGRAVMWYEVATLIDVVTHQSFVFEKWLQKTEARYLFAVCWYDPLVMAATMAARRCGIKTIEIQHGSQGEWHFAYSAWLRAPSEGYEVVPDVFWCWGKTAVEELHEYNPAFFVKSSAVPGGNLWLNLWRERVQRTTLTSSEKPAAPHKTILVSLQLDVEPLLLDAIRASPSSWRWLIRFHPAREKSSRVQEELMFKHASHPGVELDKANSLVLYELLGESDVHVTAYSACAIEALAFGVQTIIISSQGRMTFSSLIDQGLMMTADTSEKLIIEIEHAQRINPDKTPAIASMFANGDDAIVAVQRIIKQEA